MWYKVTCLLHNFIKYEKNNENYYQIKRQNYQEIK